MSLILKSLYFFLPAYVANMSPVLFRWVPLGKKPVHKKLFGKNKTWRGLIVASLLGTFVFWLQKYFYLQGFEKLALIDYSDMTLLLGFLLGAGAILGDLVESYYKRRKGVKPGEPWPVWDQLDFVIGGIVLSFFVYVPPAGVVLVLLVASPILHISVNYLGYLLGIRKVRF